MFVLTADVTFLFNYLWFCTRQAAEGSDTWDEQLFLENNYLFAAK